jgi:hypothetical protein
MQRIILILILIFSTWDLRVGPSVLTIGQLSIFLYTLISSFALANSGTLRNIIKISLIIFLLIFSDLAIGGKARLYEAQNSIMFLAAQLAAGAILLTHIRKLGKQTVVNSFLFVIGFFSVASLADTITRSAFGMSLVFVPGGNLTDRAFFSDDPNWPAMLVATLSGFIVLIERGRRAALSLMFAAAVMIYASSRAAQLIWLFSIFVYFYKSQSTTIRALNLMTSAIFVIGTTFAFSEILEILPSQYVYDILDLNRNPRLNDYIFIFKEMQAAGELTFGAGFGPIDRYTLNMTWRENYPVSNQLWLQVLANFGFFGLTIFILLSVFFLYSASNAPTRLAIFAFMFSLQLHNYSQKSFFGILFFSGIYAVQLSTKRKEE